MPLGSSLLVINKHTFSADSIFVNCKECSFSEGTIKKKSVVS